MTNAPKPSGGMPTWLIVILVILLFLILGCCGGFYACLHVANTAKTALIEKGKQIADAQKKALEQDATRRAEEIKNSQPLPAPKYGENTGPTPGITAPTPPSQPNPVLDVTTNMPANFPADIPVYAGATPTGGLADKIHGTGTVALESTEKVDTIANFYEKQMADKGWTIDTNLTISGSAIQAYSKDTRKAAITIMPENGKTKVSITYGPK